MKISTVGISAATFAAALSFDDSVHAAAVVVDWLNLATGATTSAFTLNSDDGLPVAFGSLAIMSGKGVSFPNFPASSTFNSGYWSLPATGFEDSVTGNDQVGAFDIRVVPQGGMASYSLTLDVPAGREFIIAVGGLSRTALGATQSITASVSGGGGVTFIKSLAWNNGGTVFDQELEWDALTGSLSTTIGADGESEVTFLRVSALSGPAPKIMFLVPDGYGAGTGDSISIGIGTVVPEPGLFGLSVVGALFFLFGRRR